MEIQENKRLQDRIIKGLDLKELTTLDDFIFQKQLEDFKKENFENENNKREQALNLMGKTESIKKEGKKGEENILNKYLFEEEKQEDTKLAVQNY